MQRRSALPPSASRKRRRDYDEPQSLATRLRLRRQQRRFSPSDATRGLACDEGVSLTSRPRDDDAGDVRRRALRRGLLRRRRREARVRKTGVTKLRGEGARWSSSSAPCVSRVFSSSIVLRNSSRSFLRSSFSCRSASTSMPVGAPMYLLM